STGCVALVLIHDSAIVVGPSVIWFEFDCACIISNCAIEVFVLRSSVAAVVVSGRVCGSQVDGPGVVGNGAGRVLLQPFGLGAVVIRGVIFWIQFGRAIEISDSTV